jgi:hypothetical protein
MLRLAVNKMPTEREENRLVAQLVECQRKGRVLRTELEHPTHSRLYGTQMMLLQAVKTAADECHTIILAIRANRQSIEARERSCPERRP